MFNSGAFRAWRLAVDREEACNDRREISLGEALIKMKRDKKREAAFSHCPARQKKRTGIKRIQQREM